MSLQGHTQHCHGMENRVLPGPEASEQKLLHCKPLGYCEDLRFIYSSFHSVWGASVHYKATCLTGRGIMKPG